MSGISCEAGLVSLCRLFTPLSVACLFRVKCHCRKLLRIGFLGEDCRLFRSRVACRFSVPLGKGRRGSFLFFRHPTEKKVKSVKLKTGLWDRCRLGPGKIPRLNCFNDKMPKKESSLFEALGRVSRPLVASLYIYKCQTK